MVHLRSLGRPLRKNHPPKVHWTPHLEICSAQDHVDSGKNGLTIAKEHLKMASAAQHASVIPEKNLFRIGEVSRLTGTKAFVLRYWETEFPTLEPVKSASGHRMYRREDIETVFEIKRLLYDEGFTIAGARRHLAEQSGNVETNAEVSVAPQPPAREHELSRTQRKCLLDLREELLAILTLFEGQ
jgi:DNA-binding transcriptional MerR regulator